MPFEQEEKKPKKEKVIPKPAEEKPKPVPTKSKDKKMAKEKKVDPNKKAKEIAQRAEELFSPEIKKSMGKYWEQYKYEIGYVLQEYNITIEQLAKYINGNKEVLDAMTNRVIRIAKENNDRLYSPREEVYTIVVSAYISGYIHGIDPPLLVAIADRETRFIIDKRSSTADVGPFQVNLYSSAVTELLGGTPESRRLQTRNVKKSVEIFEGFEFRGIVRGVRMGVDENERECVNKEDSYLLQKRPLYNAIWAARTLCLKARASSVNITSKEDMGVDENIQRLLRKYNGTGKNAENYAIAVTSYYIDVYKSIENDAKTKPFPAVSK